MVRGSDAFDNIPSFVKKNTNLKNQANVMSE